MPPFFRPLNITGVRYARSGPIVIYFLTIGNAGPYAETEDEIGRISHEIVDYFPGNAISDSRW